MTAAPAAPSAPATPVRTTRAGALLFLALATLFLSNAEGIAGAAQTAGALLVVLAGAAAVMARQVMPVPPGGIEWLLLLMGLVSVAVNIAAPADPYSGPYSLVFLAVLAALMALTRALSAAAILAIAAHAWLAATVLVLVSDLPALLTSLRAETGPETALIRFRPFGLHPNLTGFVFGAGAILMGDRARRCAGIGRAALGAGAVVAVAVILAASARAGLVALGAAVLLTWLAGLRRPPPGGAGRALALLLLPALGAAALAWVFLAIDGPGAHLARLLDLGSETRGLGSGGTGRVALWQAGLDHVAAGGTGRLLFGAGLRSASPGTIGFLTESSYVTLAIESGLVLGAAFVLGLGALAVGAARRGARGDATARTIACLVFFALVQSVFNRYLLAIGNPFSVLVIALVLPFLRPAPAPIPVPRPASGPQEG
ncbi:MAG: hypothetical protein IT542_05065 [Rubellimicrobium sp.]|nr:hypothetical protein [Rubellimicrobium sp.]